jgi:hypothetical protein
VTANFIKTYPVNKLTKSLSGNLAEVPWEYAERLTEFSYPWENEPPPTLEFKALHDGEWFYCFYNVIDQESSVYSLTNHKDEVLCGDRVEIFFTPDRSLSRYYCIEIDQLGRVYDYEAAFYRKFDSGWSWPADHIAVQARKTEAGYHVLLALSIASLKELDLVHDNEMIVGLFRGKCAAASSSKSSMRWMSWLRPASQEPDFHIPSSFGKFLFA